jgi:hypothetical protein
MTDDAPVTIPLDEHGQPDLQALVRLCGGYNKITATTWAAWDRANADWQQRRRQGMAPAPPKRPR